MKYKEYNTRIIICSAKRGSRLLKYNTLPINNNFIELDNPKFIEEFKKLSKQKKVFIINREPIGHLKSGLVNSCESNYKNPDYPCHKEINEMINSELGDYFSKLIYLSADESEFEKNYKDTSIESVISQKGLLGLLNWFVNLYNEKHQKIYQMILDDEHLSSRQDIVKKITELFDCEVVNMEEQKNLLSYLGFKFSDEENDRLKKRYSQKGPKMFFSMFVDYIMSNDINVVISHFKKIYGKCSVIRGGNLTKVKIQDYFIDYVNNEVKIFNEIK